MRPRDIISAILFAVLLSWIFLLITENKLESDLKQTEIDHLKKTNEANEKRHLRAVDSITKIQAIQADSTRYYRLLKTKDQQSVKTKTESHEKIVFVNLNDSARHSKLAKFYPSYVRP